MPWTPADADKHVKGLTPHGKEVWASVANRALMDCKGDDCEAKAIRIANAQAQRVGKVAKIDEEQRLVFGYVYVAKTKDGETVIDHSGEFVDPADLEDAMYKYVLESRESNDMHEGPVTGKLVESFVITPDKLEAMGLEKNALPLGIWAGFQLDPEAFEKVKTGERRAFSIEGSASKVEV
jgi:hypothetical protein